MTERWYGLDRKGRILAEVDADDAIQAHYKLVEQIGTSLDTVEKQATYERRIQLLNTVTKRREP